MLLGFFFAYKKNLLISKYINKEVGQNALSSYKRAFNIIEKEGKNIEDSSFNELEDMWNNIKKNNNS